MIQLFKEWAEKNIADKEYVFICLFILFGLIGIYFFGNILLPVFAALIISFLLEGLIQPLMRLKIPRPVAVIIVFIIYLICFVIIILWLYPLLSRQIIQLFQQLPTMLLAGKKQLMKLPEQYPDLVTAPQLQELYNFTSSALSGFAKRMLMVSISSVKPFVSFIIYLVLVPFLVFFFLKDKEIIINWVSDLFPKKNELAALVWDRVNIQITNYVRGKGWEILIVWAATFIAYFFIGLQYALLLSFLSGISVILPYIGVIIVFIPTVAVSYFQFGWDALFVWSLAAYTFIQLIDAHILVPLLLSEVINLHPVAIVIAVLFFGGIWGLWGLFFSIPLAIVIKVLLDTRPSETAA